MLADLSHPGYVLSGWGITTVVLGLYALRIVRRAQRLAAQVPPEERRWT
jgi:hypothetical protein